MTENDPRNDQHEYLSADELLAKLERNLEPSRSSSKWAFWNRRRKDDDSLSARTPEERYELFQQLGQEAEQEEKKAKQEMEAAKKAEAERREAEARAAEEARRREAEKQAIMERAARAEREMREAEEAERKEAEADASDGSESAPEVVAPVQTEQLPTAAEPTVDSDDAPESQTDAATITPQLEQAKEAVAGSTKRLLNKAKGLLPASNKGAKRTKMGNQNDNQALVKGSFWLSMGNIVSRLLGAAFILPWLAMLGAAANQGNALFSQGYNIYGILLSIATFGFPSAISKVMAQLIAKEDEEGLWSLTKQSLQIGTILGVVFTVLLYVSAPLLSNGNPNVIPVLHSLAPAVLVFPAMSMVRGIFQGHQLMHISAISEVVEQIGRIVYLLIATWVVLSANSSNWTGAVVQATFAAFIGALFAIAVLAYGWVSYKELLHPTVQAAEEQGGRPLVYQKKVKAKTSVLDFVKPGQTRDMVLNILKESWPFVIIGASTNLFLFVDQYSFFPLMKAFFQETGNSLQVQFALFSANPNKLVMIVISFATSIAATALPILAAKKTEGDAAGLQEQVLTTIKLTALVLLPSALGMYGISDVLYKFFYPIDGTAQAGIYLLQFSSLLTILMALYMLMAFVLQALSEPKTVVRAFFWGLLVKVVLQAPLVFLFQGMGALLASAFGFGWSLYLMLSFLQKKYGVTFESLKHTLLHAYLASAAMALVAFLVSEISANFIWSDSTKMGAGFATFLGAAAGGGLLIYLYRRLGLLGEILNRGRQ